MLHAAGQTQAHSAAGFVRTPCLLPPAILLKFAPLLAVCFCAVVQVVAERGLQPHPSWLQKAMELYETYLVGAGVVWWVLAGLAWWVLAGLAWWVLVPLWWWLGGR
jgi:hypothetical protein